MGKRSKRPKLTTVAVFESTRDTINREAEKRDMTQAEYLSDLIKSQARNGKAAAVNESSCSEDDKIATIGDIKKILNKGIKDIKDSNKNLIERREKSSDSLKISVDANTATSQELIKIIKGQDNEHKDTEQESLFW